MATETKAVQTVSKAKQRAWKGTLARVAKYTGLRSVTMIITIIIGVYLTILIANMGGYVDEIMRGNIEDNVANTLRNQESFQEIKP